MSVNHSSIRAIRKKEIDGGGSYDCDIHIGPTRREKMVLGEAVQVGLLFSRWICRWRRLMSHQLRTSLCHGGCVEIDSSWSIMFGLQYHSVICPAHFLYRDGGCPMN